VKSAEKEVNMDRTKNGRGRLALRWTDLASATIITLLLAGVAHADLGLGAKGAWVTNRDTDDSVGMVGGFLRLGPPMLSLEAGVDYRNEELANDLSMKTWPVTVGVVFQPIPILYAVAGVGWYHTTLDFSMPSSAVYKDETTTEFGYHAGAGLRFTIVPAVSAIADVRYSYVDYDFDQFTDAVGDLDKGNYVSLNAGLMFQLPGPKTAE
jgi:opacity protein-like surface antigen